MKHLFAVFILMLLTLCTTLPCCAGEGHKRKQTVGSKSTVNPSRTDTTFSIRVSGPSNSVMINNRPVSTTPGKTDTKNTITVSGEGNSVSVNKADQNSTVNISQNGNNNQINISQKR